MSLDTYENLKLEILAWSNRDDGDLFLDTFINLAETEMYSNTVEPLQPRGGETLVAFTTNTTDRFVALPTGFIEMRKVRIQIVNGESHELEFRTPGQLNLLSAEGQPQFFTVTDQIEFERVSDQAYAGEFQYYKEFTPLSTAAPTNFVLTKFPHVYLFGALWALKLKAEELEEASMYHQRFLSAISGANNNDKLGRYGPAPVMRVEGSTP